MDVYLLSLPLSLSLKSGFRQALPPHPKKSKGPGSLWLHDIFWYMYFKFNLFCNFNEILQVVTILKLLIQANENNLECTTRRMEAPASTLHKINVFSAMSRKISVFSANIKVRQICLMGKSCTDHIDSQQRWSPNYIPHTC